MNAYSFLYAALLPVLTFSFQNSLPQQEQELPQKMTSKVMVYYKDTSEAQINPFGVTNTTSTCYTYNASGAKWKQTEPYLINPRNSRLTDSTVRTAVLGSVSEWENKSGFNIFGNYSVSTTAVNKNYVDGKNTVSFAPNSNQNVLAMTVIWGYFNGSNGEIKEWDMVLNNRWVWGNAALDNTVIDLQSIVTHELGHAAGLGDLYSLGCKSETMYGYAKVGETIKRSLNTGDIYGINLLY